MKKVFFFGTGNCAKLFVEKVELTLKALGDFQIMGFLDNDSNKIGGMYKKYKIYSPQILQSTSCDLILLFLMNDVDCEIVCKQLSKYVSPCLIQRYFYPLKILLQKNYKDTNDIEIRNTLTYIGDNTMTVYNQFISEPQTFDEVKWDKQIDLPYVDFATVEGKRLPMYYPKNYSYFTKKNEKLYVEGLMWEQNIGSPHLYVKEDHNICDGDSLIDAGVSEGNFALKYIDIVSHAYLFEMDPIWQEPLKYTFRNYEDKVTIINKAVSDKTSMNTCRIDDIILRNKVNFIKMDVEGAEESAIIGAEETFRANNIKASICSYHRNGDEERIRKQFERYGYKSTVSSGYMLFLHAMDTWEMGDLRHGIVYGEKNDY